ncbi:MAG TPA: hypothetical protein VH255_08810 [Verrucomicrobiae bacterium]|jgi:hypothetical protein|nr:hypothetical protein [Verrucomicrobiae bacterium]
MEIELNPGRLNDPGTSQPVTRRAATPSTDTITLPHERTQALEQSLRDAPQVRADAVAKAKALVSDADYPSGETLDRVASLLSQHLKS